MYVLLLPFSVYLSNKKRSLASSIEASSSTTLTLTMFQFTVLPVELGMKEEVREMLQLLRMGDIRDE